MKEAFGGLSTDWKEGINWPAVREWRLARAREAMSRHGLGALLLMYDENMRYVSSTYTPGWNRLKPGLRYVVLCEGREPIVCEQGDIGIHLKAHNPWIPPVNVRHPRWSAAWRPHRGRVPPRDRDRPGSGRRFMVRHDQRRNRRSGTDPAPHARGPGASRVTSGGGRSLTGPRHLLLCVFARGMP